MVYNLHKQCHVRGVCITPLLYNYRDFPAKSMVCTVQMFFPMQNEYCECANLILSHYPDQIDHLLALVFSEKIAEAKMQQLLNYLSKNSTQLLSRILSKLASNTCLAGMELLR